MLAVKLEISSFKEAMAPSPSEIAVSNSFFLRNIASVSSSDTSNSFVQYSFFLSSSTCSLPNWITNLSIISANLSKLVFLPCMANEMKSKRESLRMSAPKTCLACRMTSLLDTCTCSNEVLGRVFLKRSKASSSFKILMVSERATSSSDRVLDRAAHSSFFVAQFLPKSAKNLMSSAKPFFVSSRSSIMFTRSVLTLPRRAVFFSAASTRDLTSLFFAAQSFSKSSMASFSVFSISSRSFSVVSFNCFKMPTISPLAGA
mmetsp:Transcript_92716/g.240013  ORF Transcript_92716/g.240013 Transcript_92716/m.240013 type:complete len:259 (-) Transcript_92716:435-1211(-)